MRNFVRNEIRYSAKIMYIDRSIWKNWTMYLIDFLNNSLCQANSKYWLTCPQLKDFENDSVVFSLPYTSYLTCN